VGYTVIFKDGKVVSIKNSGYEKREARDSNLMYADWKEKDEQDEQAIRDRAYQIYLERLEKGSPGDDLSDWLAAEQESEYEGCN
jgi:hypothetical protein